MELFIAALAAVLVAATWAVFKLVASLEPRR